MNLLLEKNYASISFAGDGWQASANLTPAAGGVHACYYHKVNESTQIGCELEGSLRTQECTGTVGYQIDIPNAALTFRGKSKTDIFMV